MTTFKVPVREEVSASSQQSFDTLKKALGMVPNLYATLAYSENGLSRVPGFSECSHYPFQQRKRSGEPRGEPGEWL